MEIGQKIAQIRQEKGITQAELARAADISRASVINYETLVTEPGKKILQRIIRALESNWDQFFEEHTIIPTAPDKPMRETITDIYRKKNKHLLKVLESQEQEIAMLKEENEALRKTIQLQKPGSMEILA